MRKFKIDKEISKRLTSLILAGLLPIAGFAGCSKKDENEDTTSYIESSSVIDDNYEEENIEHSIVKEIVDSTNTKVNSLLPELNNEIKYNSTLMLLLDIFTQKDENGKISADLISQFKYNLDVDKMMDDFNSLLDVIQYKIITEEKVYKVSPILPDELSSDKAILSNIESILENVIRYSNEKDKNNVVSEFNKIYTLIVEEKELDMNGITFSIRDLTYPSRAVANNYAEAIAYYSRNYISEEKYSNLDKRANDQNNKAYMKSQLEILDNYIVGTSETDVIALFNNKYDEAKKLINGKVNLSDETIKNLVNYINLKYLSSDKVSYKDKNQILGEYDDEKLNDVILAIEAINAYNLKNRDIVLSTLLVENYLNTDSGKVDKVALDFIQFNSLYLIDSTNENVDYNTLSANPYFKNIFKYFTKQDFAHKSDGKETDVIWQEISDGTNFVNNIIILYTLNKLPKVKNIDSYLERSQQNITESIQYIQITIMEECMKVDGSSYVYTSH